MDYYGVGGGYQYQAKDETDSTASENSYDYQTEVKPVSESTPYVAPVYKAETKEPTPKSETTIIYKEPTPKEPTPYIPTPKEPTPKESTKVDNKYNYGGYEAPSFGYSYKPTVKPVINKTEKPEVVSKESTPEPVYSSESTPEQVYSSESTVVEEKTAIPAYGGYTPKAYGNLAYEKSEEDSKSFLGSFNSLFKGTFGY